MDEHEATWRREEAHTAHQEEDVYYHEKEPTVTVPVEQLLAVGVNCTIRVNDNGNFMDNHNGVGGFDMLLWAQNTLPAGDPNWFLETFFRTQAVVLGNWGAKNFARISSATIDAALDTLAAAAAGTFVCFWSDRLVHDVSAVTRLDEARWALTVWLCTDDDIVEQTPESVLAAHWPHLRDS